MKEISFRKKKVDPSIFNVELFATGQTNYPKNNDNNIRDSSLCSFFVPNLAKFQRSDRMLRSHLHAEGQHRSMYTRLTPAKVSFFPSYWERSLLRFCH